MLAERLSLLLDLLDVTPSELSEYADLDRTMISRLKNGKRSPQKTSPSIEKLSHGICLYADEHDLMGLIFDTLNTPPVSPLQAEILLTDWLYAEMPDPAPVEPDRKKKDMASIFAKHLDTAMKLGELNNTTLSKMAHMDPSVISRYRNGHRIPSRTSDTLELLSRCLYDHLIQQNKGSLLAQMLRAEPSELDYSLFRNWLYADTSTKDDRQIASQLLLAFDSYSAEAGIVLPDFDEAAIPQGSDDANVYYGIDGIRAASLRFLSEAVRRGAKEILLYSDENMSWLISDMNYRIRWAALMNACVKNGIHICIIHNFNRNLNELNEAIRMWLPLYMSGMVDSYFFNRQYAPRFSHTLFLCPGVACVEGNHVTGMEKDGVYHYYTDNTEIETKCNEYYALENNSRPLLITSTPEPANIPFTRALSFSPTPAISTMPEALVKEFNHPALTKVWEEKRIRLFNALAKGDVYECFPIADTKKAADGSIRVQAFDKNETLYYSHAQYEAHLSYLKELEKEYPAYHFVPVDAAPFPTIHLLLSDGFAKISKSDRPSLSFGFTHLPLCRALYDFGETYIREHGV